MQAIYPEPLGDFGNQILVGEQIFDVCRPVNDRPARPQPMETATIDPPESEYVSSAELIEELLEFRTLSPGLERRLKDELGPRRFSRLTKQLFQVWQTDRMI